MSFFEQQTEGESATPTRMPAWIRPPANIVPVVVPLGLVLAHNQDAAIVVPAVRAYPTGLSLDLEIRVRQGPGGRRSPVPTIFGYETTSDEFVRLGVRYSDGRKATNLRRPKAPRAGEPPPGPLLTPGGGSGGQGAWGASYWLWPLPPPGQLVIVANWPAYRLGETSAEIDADPILAAAALAVTLWPEDDSSGGQVGDERIAGGG